MSELIPHVKNRGLHLEEVIKDGKKVPRFKFVGESS